ncbi:5000_t:CDS:2 [Funneliformis geosporum]|uniref:19995_t:CDS:1 n=1 Tax=Funneliformis geosporum TaxID=1117311 RepID=A0A9W4SEG0_9GLOM|nr:5000_t:CDS:2 [Funneliformis geosporum]CAI2166451.1 19995_t:CDS:2 [Funneliformis geosporum]
MAQSFENSGVESACFSAESTTESTLTTAAGIHADKNNENEQSNEYKNYLFKIIILPSTMERYEAKDNQQFLTVIDKQRKLWTHWIFQY